MSATPSRRRVGTALVVAALAAALLTALMVGTDGTPTGLDRALTTLTRGWADPLGWPVDAAHVLGLVTAPVASVVLGTVVVLILAARGFRAAAGYLALSAALGVVLTELLKRSVGRTRPPGAEEFEHDLDRSFPSGHASCGIYLYLTLGLVLLRIARARRVAGRPSRGLELTGAALVVLGPTIGLSRLVLGVHWPTDTLGGWSVGSSASLAAALLLWVGLDRGWAGRTAAVEVDQGPGSAAAGPVT